MEMDFTNNEEVRPYLRENALGDEAAVNHKIFMEPLGNAASMQPDIVTCQGLTKCYIKGKAALDNMTVAIPSGRIVGLLGPNGSGKSTFIKLLNGLLTPTSGEILIDGEKPGSYTKSIVSYLPERTYLNAQKDVESMIEFFEDFYEDFDAQRAYTLMTDLGINPKDKLKTMSKGTREKVQLILVMSRRARLFVLDEPIAGVDPAARDYILRTIIGNYNPEATIIICTHLISDIENILDDVLFIQKGKIVMSGHADKIRRECQMSIDAYFREVFAC